MGTQKFNIEEISKILISKGYKYTFSPGSYLNDEIYSHTYIVLHYDIKDIRPLIPECYYNKFHMTTEKVNGGIITFFFISPKEGINDYNEFMNVKSEFLELFTYMARELPDNPLADR